MNLLNALPTFSTGRKLIVGWISKFTSVIHQGFSVDYGEIRLIHPTGPTNPRRPKFLSSVELRTSRLRIVQQLVIFILCLHWIIPLQACQHPVSIDLNDVELKHALYAVAKFENENLIVAPAVSGTISLHLLNVCPEQILALLCEENGLQRRRSANVSFIGPKGISPKDPPVVDRQLFIQAKIIHLDETGLKKLGLEWPTQLKIPIFKFQDSDHLMMEINLLEQQGRATIVSSPALVTINGKAAEIESGEEIPYQEKTSMGNTSVAFKKAVLRLRVTPTLLSASQILLQMVVNEDKLSSIIVQGVPAIRTQQLSTQVILKPNEMVLLGGIHESVEQHLHRGVPVLSKLPGLRYLFRNSEHRQEQRQLFILVRVC